MECEVFFFTQRPRRKVNAKAAKKGFTQRFAKKVFRKGHEDNLPKSMLSYRAEHSGVEISPEKKTTFSGDVSTAVDMTARFLGDVSTAVDMTTGFWEIDSLCSHESAFG